MLEAVALGTAGGGGGVRTVWRSLAVLPSKLPSGANVAVRVRSPGWVRVSEQAPSPTLAAQVSPPPLAVTVTVPVGVPDAAVTAKVTVTDCPTSEGSGSSDVIRIVVPTGCGAATVCPSVSTLLANSSLPEYTVVRIRPPAVDGAKLHSPAATGALQLAPSSEVTRTVPSGEPPGDCTRNRTRTA